MSQCLLPSGGWEVQANILSSDNHMNHNLKNTLRILHQIVGGFYLWYIRFKVFSTSEMLCVFGCDVIVMLRFDQNDHAYNERMWSSAVRLYQLLNIL